MRIFILQVLAGYFTSDTGYKQESAGGLAGTVDEASSAEFVARVRPKLGTETTILASAQP